MILVKNVSDGRQRRLWIERIVDVKWNLISD